MEESENDSQHTHNEPGESEPIPIVYGEPVFRPMGYHLKGDQPPQSQVPLPFPPKAPEAPPEAEELTAIVGKYFSIYETESVKDAMIYFCHVSDASLEGDFRKLRNELKELSYFPFLSREGGEYILYVTKKEQARYKSLKVNAALLVATLVTTILAGATQWAPYNEELPKYADPIATYAHILLNPENLLFGALYFALPLMLILGTHELGHYIAARRHGVAASLPFFIPVPPFGLALGTFGAFISMREPIPDKKALMDIGIAGPIVGFLVAIPVTILGLVLTNTYQIPVDPLERAIMFNPPLILMGFDAIIPITGNYYAHPMYFAGWVGFFITALNLLPVGQLDGGHIVRAALGTRSRWVSMGAVFAIIGMTFVFGFMSFLLIILLLMFFGGLQHPPPLNDFAKLDNRRKALGIIAAVMLVMCFHPAPLADAGSPQVELYMGSDFNEMAMGPGNTSIFNFSLELASPVPTEVTLNFLDDFTVTQKGWSVVMAYDADQVESETGLSLDFNASGSLSFTLEPDNGKAYFNGTITISIPATAPVGENYTVTLAATWLSNELEVVGEYMERATKQTSRSWLISVE